MERNKELHKKYERSVNSLNEFAKKDYIFKNSVQQIRQFYQYIAWHNWVNLKDLASFKLNLHNSILTLIRSNEYFKNLGSFMTLPRIILCELALTDNQDLVENFSNQDYEVRLSESKSEFYSENVQSGGSLIYAALILASMKGDMRKLTNLIELVNCPSTKKKNIYFEDELPFFQGLLEQNTDLISKTINQISSPRNHKRTNSHNGIFKDFTSFPAVGYAKIAWINNHQLELRNELIDNELLPILPNPSYENDVDLVIDKMTLESEYLYHNGAKKKIRTDVYDVFVYSTDDLSGKTSTVEDLIPNIFDNRPNFIGLKTGNSYSCGYLIGTNRKEDSNSLFKKANEIKKVGLFHKKRAKLLLQKYLDDIDEISKTQRGVKIKLNDDLTLRHEPIKVQAKSHKQKALSKKRTAALVELGKLIFDEELYEMYLNEIKSLKDYDGHEKYGSTLNYLSTKLQDGLLLQFFSLDWKTEILQLDSLIEQSLKQNFVLNINLDVSSKFDHQSSISHEGCFREFRNALRSQAMELKILDSGGDNYIFLLHRSKDNERILELLEEIEFLQINTDNNYG